MEQPNQATCAFCNGDATTPEKDGNGKVFYCCGWCWAHILNGGFIPQDITPRIEYERKLRRLPPLAV